MDISKSINTQPRAPAQGIAKRVVVSVVARHDTSGKVTPLSVTWPDWRVFEVSRVYNVCRAASLKAGGQGMRYSCRIAGKDAYLFFDDPVWFMEGRA